MTVPSSDKQDSTGVQICSGGVQTIALAESLKEAREDEVTPSSTY